MELNDANPAALANAINKAANDALRVAKDYKSVRVRSGSNQTYPVYTKGNCCRAGAGAPRSASRARISRRRRADRTT